MTAPGAWRVARRVCLTVALTAAATGAAAAEARNCLVADWPRLPAGRELGQAAGVGIDSRGTVYVFHRASRSWGQDDSAAGWAARLWQRLFGGAAADRIPEDTVLALHPQSGSLLAAFGAGRFRMPHGLTADAENHLWVTDVDLHQVFKLSRDGTVLLALGEAGVAGNDRAHFNGPTDVAVGSDGSIYVADGYGNARVVKFSAAGEYQLEWGGRGSAAGHFDLPHGIAVDAQDNLYVADRGNARVQVFDRDGGFLRQISGSEVGRPWAVDIGVDGRLYVVDGGDQDPAHPRSGLVVLTPEGKVLARWSGYGYEAGRLVWPHDLAVARSGEVFVVEVLDSNRVQKFRPGCSAAAPTG